VTKRELLGLLGQIPQQHGSGGIPLVVPQIHVDSTSPSYSPRPLNDGLRVAAVQFEPDAA
jgi:hypothetical protein